MTNEFNADEFCNQMQQKAKHLAVVKKQVNKQRTQDGTVTLIINGKKIRHKLPCDVLRCDVCDTIERIYDDIDSMINDMHEDLFNIFGYGWF